MTNNLVVRSSSTEFLINIEKLRLMKKSIELIEKYGESEAGFVNKIKFNPINK